MKKYDKQEHEKPQVGIFWKVQADIIYVTVDVEYAPSTQGIRDADVDHYSQWEKLPDLRHKGSVSYDYYPRGRVVYCEHDQRFVIYADRCLIADKRFIGKLQKTLALTSSKCEVKDDAHYKCHVCNPDFISDFE